MSVYPTDLYPGCPCHACDSPTWPAGFIDIAPGAFYRMSLCPNCGSKRCAGAIDHTKHPKEAP